MPAKKTTKRSKTAKAAKSAKTARKQPKDTSTVHAEQAAKAAAMAMRDIVARARDHFRTAPHDQTFFLKDGRQLRTIKELAEALEDMHDHVFTHHVRHDSHDFANWVHEVLKERALAEQLRGTQNPNDSVTVIYRHIVRRVW